MCVSGRCLLQFVWKDHLLHAHKRPGREREREREDEEEGKVVMERKTGLQALALSTSRSASDSVRTALHRSRCVHGEGVGHAWWGGGGGGSRLLTLWPYGVGLVGRRFDSAMGTRVERRDGEGECTSKCG